jgi:NAD(P)H dehydrogenase (quinone)
MTLIAVTGATGALGGRVAAGLAAAGVALRLIVRDADRAPELPGAELALASGYHDRPAMTAALRGADTLLLVSGRESADRVAEHISAVDAAADAGVRRIVYTSFSGAASDATFTLARHHAATEEHIRGTGLARTFLRNAMYADFAAFFANDDGVIAAPAGDGRVAFVARADIAAAAVVVLTEGARHDGRTYELTGPEALTLAEVAALLTEVTGRPVRYVPETVEEAYASRAHFGAPDYEVEGWVTSFTAIAAGELARVTGDVEALLGRPPLTLAALLAADPDSYAHLIPNSA